MSAMEVQCMACGAIMPGHTPTCPANRPSYYQGTPDAPHRDFDAAVEATADALMSFARYLANEQGAADTGSMKRLLAAAYDRYEQKEEEEFC